MWIEGKSNDNSAPQVPSGEVQAENGGVVEKSVRNTGQGSPARQNSPGSAQRIGHGSPMRQSDQSAERGTIFDLDKEVAEEVDLTEAVDSPNVKDYDTRTHTATHHPLARPLHQNPQVPSTRTSIPSPIRRRSVTLDCDMQWQRKYEPWS
ncbi:hypothetical protein CRG98_005213 [Punica granatum]|uniref:Uncharacterized protein n=1 Tax=Punica granatum TaxID=22663 RepID=A0A2I0L148_PUNGR|nr:hypothetical protein CRG98_005213 [Punica granatum]